MIVLLGLGACQNVPDSKARALALGSQVRQSRWKYDWLPGGGLLLRKRHRPVAYTISPVRGSTSAIFQREGSDFGRTRKEIFIEPVVER